MPLKSNVTGVDVMGFPECANRELGEKVCNEMVNGLIKYVEALENSVKY